MKRIPLFIMIALLSSVLLAGCQKYSDTVQTCKISNISYEDQKDLEAADQQDTLSSKEHVYASIHFIESPLGSEYTVCWFLNGSKIKSESQNTEADCQDILIYKLDNEKLAPGTLKLEVSYKDTIIYTKELNIE